MIRTKFTGAMLARARARELDRARVLDAREQGRNAGYSSGYSTARRELTRDVVLLPNDRATIGKPPDHPFCDVYAPAGETAYHPERTPSPPPLVPIIRFRAVAMRLETGGGAIVWWNWEPT